MKTRGPCKLKVTNQINTTGLKIPTGRRTFRVIHWVGNLPSAVVETKDKSSWMLTKRWFESGESVFQFSTLNDNLWTRTTILLVKPTEKKLCLTQNIECTTKVKALLSLLLTVSLNSAYFTHWLACFVNVLFQCTLGIVVDITTHLWYFQLITCFSYCTTEVDQIIVAVNYNLPVYNRLPLWAMYS